MAIVKFILSVEDIGVENEDFNITDAEAQELLNQLEDLLCRQNYTIHDQEWEREE